MKSTASEPGLIFLINYSASILFGLTLVVFYHDHYYYYYCYYYFKKLPIWGHVNADVLRGSSRVPAPRTSADLSGKKRRPVTADFHIWEVHFGP